MQKQKYPEFKELIAMAAGNKGFLALFLVGSYGTPYYSGLSDLDFAILADGHLQLDEQLALSSAFSDVLKTDRVDLIFLTDAPLTLQYRVLETGRLLYVKDRILLADFFETVTRRYHDFSVFLNRFYKDYDYGLRKGFL